jgi:lipopolysaccharide assembly outer membrane protein LptD (OstA)
MLVSQDSYSLDFEEFGESKPTIEFFNIKDYKITANGADVYSTASRAQRFADRDILYDIDVLMVKQEGMDRLKSDNGTRKDDILYLNGNVKYEKADSSSLVAESVEYHELNKTLVGKSPFVFEGRGVKTFGDSFTYDVKNGKMEAQNVRVLIQMRDK